MSDDNGAEAANNASADATRLNAEISKDQWNRYKEVFDQRERDFVADAFNSDSPGEYLKAAGDASATVTDQYDKARDRLNRTPGVDPTSAAYTSSMVGLNLAQAADDVVSQNTARQRVKDTALTRKQSALALGKGLDSTAAAGLASVAQQSASQANAAYGRASQTAAGIGSLTGQVIGKLPGLFKGSGNGGDISGAVNTLDSVSFGMGADAQPGLGSLSLGF